MTASAQLGRRERKKADTRAALIDASRKLFEAQGYAHTTVQQISEAADVSERTFFRYFQSKEDLLLPGLASLLDRIAQRFEQSASGGNSLEVLKDSVEAVVVEEFSKGGFMPLPLPGFWPDGLSARVARLYLEWERRLADIVRGRISSTEPGIEDLEIVSGVVARCGVAAMRTTLDIIRSTGATRMPPPELSLRLLRRSFEVAQSLGSLRS